MAQRIIRGFRKENLKPQSVAFVGTLIDRFVGTILGKIYANASTRPKRFIHHPGQEL